MEPTRPDLLRRERLGVRQATRFRERLLRATEPLSWVTQYAPEVDRARAGAICIGPSLEAASASRVWSCAEGHLQEAERALADSLSGFRVLREHALVSAHTSRMIAVAGAELRSAFATLLPLLRERMIQ
jgi:hypothetical protein